jgi:hypothetical protein
VANLGLRNATAIGLEFRKLFGLMHHETASA